MARNWYPFYVGDYARKTAHLSLLEHGAYRLLLDHYYSTGLPLPCDPAKLYRICRARSPSERKAVLSTADEFFTQEGTLMRHKKCDSEINKSLEYSNSQSAKAKLRHSNGNATALPPTTTTTLSNKPPYPQPPESGVLKNGSGKVRDFDILLQLTEEGLREARKVAKGWDIYRLASIYNEGASARGSPTLPDVAFPAWCKNYTKGKSL